ncbi:MAG: metallophosphatase [Fluviicola sp. XM-24bin1]|nr:MAG: metallophosphatase [Fluviicola sp. XM-24bin1]
MNRRDFLRNTALITGGSMIAPSLFAKDALGSKSALTDKVTILHTNDTHSNIDPFPDNHAKYPGRGGVSRRFEAIEAVRASEENVLLLDAGDIFQGTPYFNMFGGVLEMKLMTQLGYDAATMGNHDFDGGMDGFKSAKEYADFPFICSNYDFSNTELDGLTEPYTIFKKGKYKVGVFGVGVELDGLVPDNKYGETQYLDPVEMATNYAAKLKEEGCDLIICLSHLGYTYEDKERMSDVNLARKTKDIHLIIGGHTHTFLDKPVEEKNADGKTVLINQVGWAGINLGRIDFYFEKAEFKQDIILIE